MARRLGRHRSTIFCELRCNHFHDGEIPKPCGSWCVVAQGLSDGRRTRQRKLVRDPGLRDRVKRCLRSGWTPERIAGRMRCENAPRRAHQEPSVATRVPGTVVGPNCGATCPQAGNAAAAIGGACAAARICFQLGTSFRPKIIAYCKQSGHRGGTGPSHPIARRRPVERSGAVPAGAWAGQCHHLDRAHEPLPGRVEGRGKTRPRRSWPRSPRRRHPCPGMPADRSLLIAAPGSSDWPHLQAKVGTQTWSCRARSPWRKGAAGNADKRFRQ